MSKSLLAQEGIESPSQNVVAAAVARVDHSVVQLETIGGKDQVSGIRVTSHPRTATIVGSDGYLVTASFNLAHQPTTIIARFPDGQRLAAEVVAENHARKVTLLRVNPDEPFPPIDFVARNELAVGQTAIAVGRSMDLQQANVSTGIISAVNRIWGKAVQTDAAISPHNFGGPLIDLDGNVIGILVPMSPQRTGVADGTEWYDSGIGFAVPLDELNLAAMVEGTDLHSGLLGVSFKEDRGYASRAIIAVCPGNSPASIAGLQVGDRITGIDGLPIERVHQVRHALGPRYAGEQINIQFERDGNIQNCDVELVQKIQPWRHAMIGVTTRTNVNQLAIDQILPGGPADDEGIKPGDILKMVGDQANPTLDAIRTILMTKDVGDPLAIEVVRDGKSIPFALKLCDLNSSPLATETILRAESSEIAEVKIAEHSNVCFGYFPESSEPSGLIMWIGEPGKVDADNELQRWQQWCDATNTILLLPESMDGKKWEPSEIEFLNKAAKQARQSADVDALRVAVGGRGAGGVMASLVAMSERESWSGLVMVNSTSSGRIANVQSEPSFRQMILMVDDKADENVWTGMTANAESLRDRGFPVHLESDNETVERLIANWIVSLGRL